MTLTQIKPAGLSKPVDLADNEKIRLGTGNDFEIYHNGTHTYLVETGSGALQIRGANLILDNADGSKRYIDCNDGGSVEVYYNGTKKLETTNSGVQLPDSSALELGDRSVGSIKGDLRLYHDGSNSYIDEVGSGNLYIRNGSDTAIFCQTNGKVELYNDGSKKFETTAGGAIVSGDLDTTGTIASAGNIKTGTDTGLIFAGASNDLRLLHDGTNSFIQNDTGNLVLAANRGGDVGGQIWIDAINGERAAKFIANGAAELYYDGSKKLETTSLGVSADYYTGTDNAQLRLGDSGDLQIYHDGSSSRIIAQNHDLIVQSNGYSIRSENGSNTFLTIISNGHMGLGTTTPHSTDWGSSADTRQVVIKATKYAVIGLEGPGATGINHRVDQGVGDNVFYMAYNNTDNQHNLRLTLDDGNFLVERGNVVLQASSAGIDFQHGSAVGTAANILDEYEEGTWTPQFVYWNGSAWVDVAFSNTPVTTNAGIYTRIGNIVHVAYYSENFLITTGATSAAGIQGLPFPCASTWTAFTVSHADCFGNDAENGAVNASASILRFFTEDNITNATWSSSLGHIMLSATYRVN